jgi:hypothetical protein
MAARKSSSSRKYGKAASKSVEAAMRRRNEGTLESGGSHAKVTSRKQAIAIGLSEAREKGAKVPPPPAKRPSARKTTARKATARTSTARTSTARKSTARKSTARKSTAKRSTARRSTAKRSR